MSEYKEQRRIAFNIVEMFMTSLHSVKSLDVLLEKPKPEIYFQYIAVLTDAVHKIIILEWPNFDDEDLFYSGG